MDEKQITLEVEQNSGQQPFAPNEDSQNVQQTGSSENFGVKTDGQELSQTEQDKIMEFLSSEAAGPTYSSSSTNSQSVQLGQVGLFLFVIVLLSGLFIFYLRFFQKKLHIVHKR